MWVLRPPPRYFSYLHAPSALEFVVRFLPSNPVIIDAGAYDGRESRLMASMWPEGHVYAFEPVSQLYEKVRKQLDGVKNATAFPLALGDQCGMQRIFLSIEADDLPTIKMITQSSSFFPPKDHLVYDHHTAFQGTQLVQMTTLDQWAANHGVGRVDFLWLDLQGYELPALKGALKVLENVSVIVTELEFVEAYQNQPLYLEVKQWLEEQGFVLVGGNFTFPKAENIWFGDGIFVRKEIAAAKGY